MRLALSDDEAAFRDDLREFFTTQVPEDVRARARAGQPRLPDDVVTAQRILNQTRAFALSDKARSRVNTAYVAGNFVGAALGSLAASLLWSTGGWTAVSITGGALSLLALLLWAVTLPRMR